MSRFKLGVNDIPLLAHTAPLESSWYTAQYWQKQSQKVRFAKTYMSILEASIITTLNFTALFLYLAKHVELPTTQQETKTNSVAGGYKQRVKHASYSNFSSH